MNKESSMKKWLINIILILSIALTGCSGYIDSKKAEEAYAKGNYDEAVKLFTKACDSGLYDECYNLGIMYDLGQGVQQNNQKSLEFFKKSCERGDKLGCKNYAELKALI